jgi:hypothetical protein
LDAFEGPKEALEAVAGFIARQKQARETMAYDSRWRGARDVRARDQGPEEYSDQELLGLIREAIGEEGPLGDALRYRAQDRRRGAQDQPPDFQGKPLTGGGMIPTTGTLTHDPANSRSANAGAQDWSPRMQREYEDMRILASGEAQRGYASRFPSAARLGRVG